MNKYLFLSVIVCLGSIVIFGPKVLSLLDSKIECDNAVSKHVESGMDSDKTGRSIEGCEKLESQYEFLRRLF